MLDLAATVSQLPEGRRPAPWAGYDHVNGWAVVGLPFDSGHVLALRVFPEADLAPYRALWHRDPGGKWAIYVDGPKACACLRYYGEACDLTARTRINIEWTEPARLHITVDDPPVDWTVNVTTNWGLELLNAVNGALPLASWRSRLLLRARERVAKALGMGDLELYGITPSGDEGTLMPARMYFINDSKAIIDGSDLGRPTRVSVNPRIGNVPLPARGVFAFRQGMWRIRDAAEFERLRQETAPS